MTRRQRSHVGYGLVALDAALQLGGYTNPYLALGLVAVAFYYLIPVWRDSWKNWRQAKTKGKELVKPTRLKIVFRYDMPWVQLQHNMQEPGGHIAHAGSLFTYRLAVINHLCDLAEKVTVEMISIDPEVVAHRLVPCRLHFRHDNPAPPQPFAQEIDVPRTSDPKYQDALFVDVFWFWESPHKEMLGIWSSVRGVDQQIPTNTYKFAIKVSSRNCGPPVTKDFRFIYRGKDKPPTFEPDDSLH